MRSQWGRYNLPRWRYHENSGGYLRMYIYFRSGLKRRGLHWPSLALWFLPHFGCLWAASQAQAEQNSSIALGRHRLIGKLWRQKQRCFTSRWAAEAKKTAGQTVKLSNDISTIWHYMIFYNILNHYWHSIMSGVGNEELDWPVICLQLDNWVTELSKECLYNVVMLFSCRLFLVCLMYA